MHIVVMISLYLMAVLSMIILWREGLIGSVKPLLAAAFFISAAFWLRAMSMDHVTLDYVNFLSRWVAHFRTNGFKALSESVGNYNLPYLYFLALFSYADFYDLYLIKLLSIAFDVLLAASSMKLVSLVTESEGKRLFTFLAVLMMPTVILNGAYWGQCDSIYTAFGVLSLYYALDGKPICAMVSIALSFAFKLQAVFIMPVFIVLLYTKRIKFGHFLIFPLTYAVLALPAVLLGRPFKETLTLYFDQMGTVGGGLNYNSPSIFAILRSSEYASILSTLGILAAFAFLLLIYAWAYTRRESADNRSVITLACLISVAIPFLLPHMHDRYFFPADVFTLIFAVMLPKYSIVPLLCSFSSLLGYHAYLKQRYLMPMSIGALSLAAVIYLLIAEFHYHLQDVDDPETKDFDNESIDKQAL